MTLRTARTKVPANLRSRFTLAGGGDDRGSRNMSQPIPISLLEDVWQIALRPPIGQPVGSGLATKIRTTPPHVCSRQTVRREVLCEWEEATELLHVFRSAAISLAFSNDRRGIELAATGTTLVIAAMRAWQTGTSTTATRT